MALDEPQENEKTTPINGLDVLISDDIKMFADRGLIDYIKSPYGEGFDIDAGYGSC